MDAKRLIGVGIVVIVLLSGILLLNTGGYLAAAGIGIIIGGTLALVIVVIAIITSPIAKRKNELTAKRNAQSREAKVEKKKNNEVRWKMQPHILLIVLGLVVAMAIIYNVWFKPPTPTSMVIIVTATSSFATPVAPATTSASETFTSMHVEYSGVTWAIMETYLEQDCTSPVNPSAKSAPGDNCFRILIDLASNTPSLFTQEPLETPLGYVLQVEDNSGNRYSPFEEVYTYDKSGAWLGHLYYFSVRKDAEHFFLLVPGNEKILLK